MRVNQHNFEKSRHKLKQEKELKTKALRTLALVYELYPQTRNLIEHKLPISLNLIKGSLNEKRN